MKKYIIIIMLIVISNITNAQTNYIPTGTWKWINNNDTIEIFFKTDIMTVGTRTFPIVIGYHKYVKNGIILENNLSFSNTNFIAQKFSIILYYKRSEDMRNDGSIKDFTLNTRKYVILKKINPTTVSINLTSMQTRRASPYYTLPRYFVLTKQ